MAIVCQVSGQAGTGKTYAVKGLIEKYPDQVYFINADKKPMTWAG
jgi:DNA transposition AAA+ family ATPase